MKLGRASLLRKGLLTFAPKRRLLYRLCKRYVDLYNNDNNDNMATNGELRFMRSALPTCRLVFDVGANVGHWAAQALRVNPNINLHCFEPSYATYQGLVANGFPSNVICNHLGLSSAAGEAQLHVFEDRSGINSLYRRQGLQDGWSLNAQRQEETIHLVTLDHYYQSHRLEGDVDFCKVDVEGHELEVFRGMSALLAAKRIRIIQFEYGGCNIDSGVLLKDIFAFFRLFDYSFSKVFPTELRPVVRYDQRMENLQYQNWVIMANAPGRYSPGLPT